MTLTKHGIIDFSAMRYIFKYQPIDYYSKLNLKNKKLWASEPSIFNDPFELKFLQIGRNYKNHLLDKFLDEASKFKIACLTYDPYNILMWSHYANKHSGMCLGFYDRQITYPVHYTNEFPSANFEETNMNKRFTEFHKILNCKAKQWEYEQERRICLIPGTPNELNYPGELFMIAFGVNSNRQDIEDVKSIVNDNDVLYYKCRMVEGHYKLEFECC